MLIKLAIRSIVYALIGLALIWIAFELLYRVLRYASAEEVRVQVHLWLLYLVAGIILAVSDLPARSRERRRPWYLVSVALFSWSQLIWLANEWSSLNLVRRGVARVLLAGPLTGLAFAWAVYRIAPILSRRNNGPMARTRRPRSRSASRR